MLKNKCHWREKSFNNAKSIVSIKFVGCVKCSFKIKITQKVVIRIQIWKRNKFITNNSKDFIYQEKYILFKTFFLSRGKIILKNKTKKTLTSVAMQI